MTKNGFTDTRCPSCSSLIRLGTDDRALNCSVCGSEHELAGHLCPHCLTYHQEFTTNCQNCDSALSRICTNCRNTNWSGSDKCSNCGQQTDIFVSFGSSVRQTTTERLSRQMEQAQDIKLNEENSSKQRMAELLAIEEARQAELRRQLAKQNKQERQLLTIVIGSVLVFLIVLVVIAVISSLN